MGGGGIEVYTDGSLSTGRGVGGFAFVAVKDDKMIKSFCKSYDKDKHGKLTSSRMEMFALISALYYTREYNNKTFLIDSKFIVDSMNSWMQYWVKNDFTRRNGGKVSNIDLWNVIYPFWRNHEFDYKWVKAHNGNKWNEFADALAKHAADIKVKKKNSIYG